MNGHSGNVRNDKIGKLFSGSAKTVPDQSRKVHPQLVHQVTHSDNDSFKACAETIHGRDYPNPCVRQQQASSVITSKRKSKFSISSKYLCLSIDCIGYLLLQVSITLLPGEHFATVIELSLRPPIDRTGILAASPMLVIIHLISTRLHLGMQLANHVVSGF